MVKLKSKANKMIKTNFSVVVTQTEMETDATGQEYIRGSKFLARFYFLRRVGCTGVFNMVILTKYRLVCALFMYTVLYSVKKMGWNLCFLRVF